MQNVEENRVICKTLSVVKQIHTLNCSPSAKALALTILATGLRSAKAVVEATGMPRSTVYRCMAELAQTDIFDLLLESPVIETTETTAIPEVSATGNIEVSPVPTTGIAEVSATGIVEEFRLARVEDNNKLTYLETTVEDKSPPTPSHVRPVTDWRSTFGADDRGVGFADGRLELVNGTRAFWLEKFDGDAKALDLALIEAAGSLQRGSNASLKLQVERKLANIVRDKRDRDRRYKSAVAANAKPAAPDRSNMVFKPSRFGPGRWVPREAVT